MICSSRPASRLPPWWHSIRHPFYDLITKWGFLPVGDERALRHKIVDWIDAHPVDRVLSLCCVSGTTELSLVE